MSSLLTLRFLGGFEVTLSTAPVGAFPTDKVRALFAYLALESPQPHRREALAALLWPDMPQAAAQTNLRLALHRLRQTLDGVAPSASATLIASTRQTVQLNRAAFTVDAATFQALLAACATHPHRDLQACDACFARMTEAADLYRGELLAGFGLDDAPTFEEWLLLRRETLHQQALAVLHTLVLACEGRGNDRQAHVYARRQLDLDPCREEAHRQLMRVLARLGLQAEAIAQYHACRRILREEMGVEPDGETTALYEQIRSGELRIENEKLKKGISQFSISEDSQFPDVPEVAKLFGRQTELAQLEHWLVHDGCRLVALLGMGGVGKTTLAVTTAKAVDAQFDQVIWRSVLNAPPPGEMLQGWLQTLSGHAITDMPASLDEQLALLMSYLRQQRCLLVLDNVETILEADPAGQMRPGFEGYAQLIRHMAEHGHRSCLLLTSRERPQGLARYEDDTPLVRTLHLNGLDAAAGEEMLLARGLAASDTDASALVQRYSGNPLALKLVAQTVHDLFGGDVRAFLATETAAFDDIRMVLDQQFARLSPLEQDIMAWLAIEREPVSMQTLRDDLVQPPSPRALVEALRALHRRSLIGQSQHGFTLQNVLMEYTTDALVEQVCGEIEGDFRFEIADCRLPDLQSAISNLKLNAFALLKATAKEYVRASQERLIVQPITTRLLSQMGKAEFVERLNGIIAEMHAQLSPPPGYAAGNVLNLLLHLGVDVGGYDFSRLHVWQAYGQGKLLPDVNFREANLAHSVFTNDFGSIHAVGFNAEGQVVIAGWVRGALCVWRAADGQLLYAAQSLGVGASIANFSRDGRLLACGYSTDHHIRVWDVTSGALLHTLAGHTETPWSVVFSPNGTLLASSGTDGIVRVWDVSTSLNTGVATGRLRATAHGHPTAVPALAFGPDGQYLASGDVDGMTQVWRISDASGLENVHTLRGHDDEVHAVVFDSTGNILVTSSHDHIIRLWDVATGETIRTLQAHTRHIRALAMSPDGHTLASGGDDPYVCLWDIRTGQSLHTLLDIPYRSTALAISPDGRTLANVGADQSVGLWDVETGRRLGNLQVHSNVLFSLDFSPDGRTLTSGGTDGILRLWDLGGVERPVENASTPDAVRVRRILTGHTGRILSACYSPDGETLASAGSDRVIRLWDLRQTGQVTRTLEGHTEDVEAVQFSPDGQLLASAGRDHTLRLWRLSDGQALRTLRGHTERVHACSFSPGGEWVASGSQDRTIRIWDVSTGEVVHTLHGHTNGIKFIAFSPVEYLLASSSFDQTLRLWDAVTGQARMTLPVHNTIITSLAFHPNGALLATGATDHTVCLWDVSTQPTLSLVPRNRGKGEGLNTGLRHNGYLVQTLHGHSNNVEAVRFSRDGRWLASGGKDETVRLWDVAAALDGRGDACVATLRAPGPYAGMNITGVTGISAAQKAALKALGATENL